MPISPELKEKLVFLADKYETPSFLQKDPSKFMHRYSSVRDQEAAAFLSANIAFGQRAQILSHIELILSQTENSPADWIQGEGYKKFFTEGDKSFYRMYTHNDFLSFFGTVKTMLDTSGTIGEYICNHYSGGFLHETICSLFPAECAIIPSSKNSAAKKMNMFLRWMVRDNSPVDLGLWSSWYKKENLLIPLDTHVMQEATKMNLLAPSASGKPKSATIKTALALTQAMKEVFPSDPAKADFALFGLGVDI
ncbi:TIGR02757 family protein [Treponema sp.]|uniref:TIGR02757 family protein n=1 Tax=Treponema sp. TaxID=166 RepID=UPI003EFE56F5